LGIAERYVQTLLGRGMLQEEVLAEIQRDGQLTPPQKAVALDKARRTQGDVAALAMSCWMTLWRSNATIEEYDRALRQVELLCRLDPDRASKHRDLGVAQLRCGQFEAAFQNLVKDSAQRKQVDPSSLAFQAMAQHHMGHVEAARQLLTRARSVMQQPPYDSLRLPEFAQVMREAEILIEPKRDTTTSLPIVEELQRAINEAIEHAKSDPSDVRSWRRAGHLQGRLGQHTIAASSSLRAWEIDQNDHAACFAAAAAMAASPEFSDRYRTLCKQAMKAFQSSNSIYQCEMTAKLCTFAPAAVDDYEPVLKLIDRAIQLDTKHEILAWTTLTKAEVLLRMQMFHDAHFLADQCLQNHLEQQRERPYYEIQARLVQSLSLRGLEDFDKAENALEQTEIVYLRHAPKPPDFGDKWIDWLYCARLRSEASSKE
jgi:tetratricopeptide (TPR) repeat protein